MTNNWYVDGDTLGFVTVRRVDDDMPVLQMVTVIDGDEFGPLSYPDALDIAQQIVDDWNFSCKELEA